MWVLNKSGLEISDLKSEIVTQKRLIKVFFFLYVCVFFFCIWEYTVLNIITGFQQRIHYWKMMINICIRWFEHQIRQFKIELNIRQTSINENHDVNGVTPIGFFNSGILEAYEKSVQQLDTKVIQSGSWNLNRCVFQCLSFQFLLIKIIANQNSGKWKCARKVWEQFFFYWILLLKLGWNSSKTRRHIGLLRFRRENPTCRFLGSTFGCQRRRFVALFHDKSWYIDWRNRMLNDFTLEIAPAEFRSLVKL